MSPRHVRGRQGVSIGDMAKRLGVEVTFVRTLEELPLDAWELGALREYLAALGLDLDVIAHDRSGGPRMQLTAR